MNYKKQRHIHIYTKIDVFDQTARLWSVRVRNDTPLPWVMIAKRMRPKPNRIVTRKITIGIVRRTVREIRMGIVVDLSWDFECGFIVRVTVTGYVRVHQATKQFNGFYRKLRIRILLQVVVLNCWSVIAVVVTLLFIVRDFE